MINLTYPILLICMNMVAIFERNHYFLTNYRNPNYVYF